MVYRSGYAKPLQPKKKQTPKTQRREMTSVEKGIIITFFYYLRKIPLIAQVIGRPWTMVKSFLAYACKHQSLENIPHPGHTPVLSRQQCCTIPPGSQHQERLLPVSCGSSASYPLDTQNVNHYSGRGACMTSAPDVGPGRQHL